MSRFTLAAMVLGSVLGFVSAAPAQAAPADAPAAARAAARSKNYGPYSSRYKAAQVANYWKSCGYCAYVYRGHGCWYVCVYDC